jgi:hypothetical protein
MLSRRRKRSLGLGRKGAAAFFALLIVPAVISVGGLAVDAGQLLIKVQTVQSACLAAAQAAFELPLDQPHLAAPVGEASLRGAGIMTGSIMVERSTGPGNAPIATATAHGIKFRTTLASMLTRGAWEWSITGIKASATRKPMAVCLVMDTSGSMCNTTPKMTNWQTERFLDAGDGSLPRQHFSQLESSGGPNYLGAEGQMPRPSTNTNPLDLVDYYEVPRYLVYDPERIHACSASDTNTWLEDYVREAKRFIREYLVDGYDRVGVIAFDWDAREAAPLNLLERNAVHAALDGLTASGPTNLAAGIRAATDQLSAVDHGQYSREMVLFTEGGANVMHARFTDVSSPAKSSDPAFAYDPNNPGSPTQVPTDLSQGLGSIYPTPEKAETKEYVVLFNPNPFDRWVFEKIDPSAPVSWSNLKTADCAGPGHLHKFSPAEPPQVYGNNYLPTEPGAGYSFGRADRSTVYGTYAIERCFDTYSYLDWEGREHSTHPRPTPLGNGTESPPPPPGTDPPNDGSEGPNTSKFDLRIPSPAYNLSFDDKVFLHPADPFVASYLNHGAKLLRFDHAAARDISLQPMMMALYEAHRAKSKEFLVTIHTLSYGFATVGGFSEQVYVPIMALNGNDYLSVKRGWQAEDRYGESFLGELSNYSHDHQVPRPDRRDVWSIGAWQTQTRGYSVAYTPMQKYPGTSTTVHPTSHTFYPINTDDNDNIFRRYASNLFGYISRKGAMPARDTAAS